MKTLALSTLAFLFQAFPVLGQTGSQLPASYYKRFEGTIGTSPIVMNLTKTPLGVRASYYYVNVGRPISLWETWEEGDQPTSADSLIFVEQSAGTDVASVDVSLVPQLYLHFASPDAIEGTWSHKGRTAQVALRNSFPQGSVQLDPYWYVDSTVIKIGKTHSGSSTSSFNVLLPGAGLPATTQRAILTTLAKILK